MKVLYGTPRRRARLVLLLLSALVSMLFGIVALSTAARVLPFFVLQAGQCCVVAGMIGLFLIARDAIAKSHQRASG